jgi:hypothetical protein
VKELNSFINIYHTSTVAEKTAFFNATVIFGFLKSFGGISGLNVNGSLGVFSATNMSTFNNTTIESHFSFPPRVIGANSMPD